MPQFDGSYDVVVVGGGPAGATVAYELALAHLSVLLLERERLPRYKPCGGIITPRVEKILDFSIAPVIERYITRMLMTIELSSPFIRKNPKPVVYTVMRDTFDNFMVQKARKAGATIEDGTPVLGLEVVDRRFVVRSAHSRVLADYVVAADGANGETRRLLGAPRHRRLSFAVEREIADSKKSLPQWNDMLALDFGFLRSGYAWLFPKANNFSLGAGGPERMAKQLDPYYEKFVSYYSDRIGHTTPYIAEGHPLPIRVANERIVYDRAVLIGDAAGLIDPMSGEGIYFAVRSGQLAAETILDAIQTGKPDLSRYQHLVDNEIQPDLQMAKSLLRIFNHAPSFWVRDVIGRSNMFWNYYCRMIIGERSYDDIRRSFGPASVIFSLLADP